MAVNVISARFVLPCGCALAHSITYSFKAEAAKHVCQAATRGSRRA